MHPPCVRIVDGGFGLATAPRERRVGPRLALFLNAYGLGAADRGAVVEALTPNHD